MKRLSMLVALLGGASVGGLAGCQDEALQTLVPEISVCPAKDAEQKQCDRAVSIGDVPVTVPLELELFVRDTGTGKLTVSKVTSSDDVLTLGDVPKEVRAGQSEPLPFTIELPAGALGERTITLTFTSDDPKKRTHTIDLLLNGVPKPAPDIVLCTDEVDAECGPEIDVDFGTVRRTQQRGVTIIVRNDGTAPLDIDEVRLESAASVEGEISIAGSTRPARLNEGDAAPLTVIYRPSDAGEDTAVIVIVSDDEDTPEARLTVRGDAAENLPPLASAFETLSGAANVEVVVGDTVQVDGTGSSDPEGDPLLYRWQLDGPDGSGAALDDDTAARAQFVPQVAGEYTATLIVTDSLGQQSAPVAVVIGARPRFGFRAQVSWLEGGDLDVHVLEQGGALFSERDCSFYARTVDFGAAGVADDDCELLDDSEDAPGPEQAVIVQPADGTYEVWVHLFDAAELAAVEATVRVIVNDEAEPVLLQTTQLPATPACATWHVADVTFPGPTVNILPPVIGTQCP